MTLDWSHCLQSGCGGPPRTSDRGRPRIGGTPRGGVAMRSRIEVYWNSIDTAPAGVAVQVRVTDGSNDEYLLPYPCKLTPDGWVNAATGSPLSVRPPIGSSTWKPSPASGSVRLPLSTSSRVRKPSPD